MSWASIRFCSAGAAASLWQPRAPNESIAMRALPYARIVTSNGRSLCHGTLGVSRQGERLQGQRTTKLAFDRFPVGIRQRAKLALDHAALDRSDDAGHRGRE